MPMRDKIERAIQMQPCTVKDLKAKFGGDRAADRKVMEALDELVRDAVVCQTQGVFFTVRSGRKDKALLCTLVKLGKNFGFAMLEDGSGDIFIPGRLMKGSMPGDRILVEKLAHPRVEGSDEGEVLAVLEQKNSLVGTTRRLGGKLVFVPDDCPAISMQILRDSEGGARDGDKVAVEIRSRGMRQEDHRVAVVMRFGSSEEAKRCAKALLYARDVHVRFPDPVREEAKKLEGAVSHYVKPGTALDNEAFERATSVYYADQVVPMLPKQLSNGICSLNEGELRLAFSCLMHLDKEGKLINYKFVKSVIRSRVKGVYSEINALLAGTADTETQYKYAEVAAQLPAMKALYTLRAGLRRERGCMDIESGEVKLILDENGRCIDVKKRVQGESEAMIEEFMLLANQCAAHFARTKQIPFVYRVHEEPGSEKLERLHALLKACGINDHFAKEVPQPKELSAILEGVRGTPYEKIIHTGLLRCMSKAEYQPVPKGHYGLVLKDYAHFTSPIRRYPDLAIHRILTALLSGMDKETILARYTDFAEKVSKQSSAQEVVAMQIERKAEDCYKAEYARAHIGEHRAGIISGVTQRGVFVELDNGVEGFVPVASLTPTGALLTEGVRLADPVSGKQWSLGDSLMITIVRADVNLGKIDFEATASNA